MKSKTTFTPGEDQEIFNACCCILAEAILLGLIGKGGTEVAHLILNKKWNELFQNESWLGYLKAIYSNKDKFSFVFSSICKLNEYFKEQMLKIFVN